ncbi:MAG TPA: bifunctional nuclease family protein [Acidimicrobiales bacterium]|nr:bifunctional nuclease family protein [Acidimicrobiales bacterium]
MHLAAVRVDLQSNTPVVLLQEAEGPRSLPIFIGAPEATAIAFALQGIDVPRPMTHDLMKNLLEALGASVESVVVTELRESTFFAEIHLQVGSRSVEVSSRPSDAIALAVRTNARLYVADELMDAAGVIIETDDEEPDEETSPPAEEIVGEFRAFLEEVRPEDFTE